MTLTEPESAHLQQLEESLWREETRYDNAYMEKILAPDFFEFGRSGRRYTREDTLNNSERGPIRSSLPLKDFAVAMINENVALVTYVSEVQYETLERANRSSMWVRTADGWQLRFHQGTPCV